ncbi:GNAT family N-acetyltransferase [Brevibacillus ginsengisoli]|uniref:GNAT family N-acetyltransferase n=1 Tax=Brevibacillus ginsengisoli TaxID=363854 RepID=UPI003CE9B6AB
MDLFTLKIIGKEIVLRLLTKDDAPLYLDYLQRNEEFHRPFVPLRPSDYITMATAEAFTDQKQMVDADQQYTFGIFTAEEDQIIGKVTLSGITRAVFQNGYISYDIDRECTNRGNVTEAVQMVVKFGLSALSLHRIQASIMPRNLASQRVVEKSGFVREGYCEQYLKIQGVWEDHYIYAITQERYDRLPSFMRNSGVVKWEA